MRINRPQDLPELRAHLLDEWRPNGPFMAEYRALHNQQFQMLTGLHDNRFAHLEPAFDVGALQHAELWWVDESMSALVAASSESLPATTLTHELVARKRPVLAYFAQPLLGIDAVAPDHTIPVSVFVFSPNVSLRSRSGEEHLTVAMYGPPTFEVFGRPPLIPLGRTDWRFGSDTQEATFDQRETDGDARLVESMAQDRRWLAALLLLASQPLAEWSTVRPMNKAKLRRLAKTGMSPDVRVVGLRTRPRSGGGERGEQGRVEHDHRWLVGATTGGFWRQQAYGPNWSLHRPKWIWPYEAGPKDKPLRVRPTVRVSSEE